MILVSYDMPWKPQLIMPIGDIQWFGEGNEVCIDKLAAHIKWGMERNAWFIGMGDYIDAFSPSNRQKLKEAGLYDTAYRVLSNAARDITDELYERALKPSCGRWLGLLAGHHYATLTDGVTTDQYLCGKLKAPFLGDCGYVRLLFNAGDKKTGQVLIWAHHGVGSGQTMAAPLNKLEKLPASWEGDIFLMGHYSRVCAIPVDRCFPIYPHASGTQEARLLYKTVLLVGTGSFMKGYIEGAERGTYVEKGMMRPVSLGAPVIYVTPRFKKVGTAGARSAGKDTRTTAWVPDLRVSL